jgi:hypothetical protein
MLTFETCTDPSLKMALYWRTRQWAVKKRAPIARSGGICERCRKNRGQLVHHLHYRTLYDERPEDLAHWCRACHDYVEGRTDFDPAAPEPTFAELMEIFDPCDEYDHEDPSRYEYDEEGFWRVHNDRLDKQCRRLRIVMNWARPKKIAGVKQRSGGICEQCRSRPSVAVHITEWDEYFFHGHSEPHPDPLRIDDLIDLCQECESTYVLWNYGWPEHSLLEPVCKHDRHSYCKECHRPVPEHILRLREMDRHYFSVWRNMKELHEDQPHYPLPTA